MISLSLSDKVMIGTALLGGMSGVVGSFAVLRGRALVGDMLAHAALPGVCLAFLITGNRHLLGLSLGALASGLAAIAAVTVILRWTRTKEDAAIGIVLSTFFGAGVVLLSVVQKPSTGGNKAGLHAYLFGEPGGMLNSDVLLLAGVAVVVLAMVALFYKEFLVVCFDTDFAQSQGWPTLWLDLAMMAALAVVTIVGLPIVGVILMAAMIILPAATARFWTNRLSVMLLVSCGFGAAAGVLGTRLGRGYPAGAAIVLTASFLFLVSLLFAPQKGLVARLLVEYRLRRRIADEHLLRTLYELSEPQLPESPVIPLESVREYRHWNSLERVLERARDEELIEWGEEQVQLTPLGVHRAAQLTKAHRLWELYLMDYANIAPDHVDRDADDVEHMLPEALLVKLEEELAAEGRLPAVLAEVPESPHELSPET
ncbi:metal ABC transporter permease [Bythopirellula polymerisocia]|uniref:Manganese transport system membrane protein MntB n=1 Tax=Bythopirellula polymerisocia TaxID=2528003 RepID=A0A5C6CHZ9_9BACT|nr:iron chelate uptake ABC transporter family permease subunit [Bythopirellula polymerisocia]TWU22846.1 Manganese transport system membrane protein MntB [Bythopirellula polymerisocia]